MLRGHYGDYSQPLPLEKWMGHHEYELYVREEVGCGCHELQPNEGKVD